MPLRASSVMASCVLLVWATMVARADSLQRQLREAANPVYEGGLTRDVREVRLAQFEETCTTLLEQHATPEEQGRIYSYMASTYAQSGTVRPEKACTYAEKAVQSPLTSAEKAQVYIYWGDVIQVSHSGVRGEALAAARRTAAIPYLHALKETLARDQIQGAAAPAGDAQGYQAEQARALAVHKGQSLQRDLSQRRETATGQIAFMYSRMPFATAELETLAIQILEDPKEVSQLMSQVKARIRKRVDDMTDEALAKLPADLEKLPLTNAAVPATIHAEATASFVPAETTGPVAAHESAVGCSGNAHATVWLTGSSAVILLGGVLLVCYLTHRAVASATRGRHERRLAKDGANP